MKPSFQPLQPLEMLAWTVRELTPSNDEDDVALVIERLPGAMNPG